MLESHSSYFFVYVAGVIPSGIVWWWCGGLVPAAVTSISKSFQNSTAPPIGDVTQQWPFPSFFRTTYTCTSHEDDVYVPEIDLEDFEDYTIGGYHPTKIGDTFHHDRYEVVHKLGFGGYSTIWLARDKYLQRYVSLKIPVAGESLKSTEGTILRMLCSGSDRAHPGRRFIPHLLDIKAAP
ncbi:hypothetical protein CHU98_g5878 [Xylaria longipes]|nr:hypothetical protein CHU98_g5878 [Xylaria longipes]